MKLADILLENDVYNKNPKLKSMIEQMVPQLHQAVVTKINADQYKEAAALLQKLATVCKSASEQLAVFQDGNAPGQAKISNTEI